MGKVSCMIFDAFWILRLNHIDTTIRDAKYQANYIGNNKVKWWTSKLGTCLGGEGNLRVYIMISIKVVEWLT